MLNQELLAEDGYSEVTPEEYNELFKPFYDAQPQDSRELQIYRDTVDDLEPRQLGLVTPDLIADYAKYETMRRAYAAEFDIIIRPESSEPTDPMYRKWRTYESISKSLMVLIELGIRR